VNKIVLKKVKLTLYFISQLSILKLQKQKKLKNRPKTGHLRSQICGGFFVSFDVNSRQMLSVYVIFSGHLRHMTLKDINLPHIYSEASFANGTVSRFV
jgi:hypothetical protein